MNILNYKNIFAVAGLLVAITFVMLMQRPDSAYGSIRVGDELTATSTASHAMYGSTITGDRLIKTGQGVLGSVVITGGTGTGIWNIYNATTSIITNRTGQVATSTILLASFPAGTAAGTYTFDIEYTTGLLIELESGVMATSTITYR